MRLAVSRSSVANGSPISWVPIPHRCIPPDASRLHPEFASGAGTVAISFDQTFPADPPDGDPSSGSLDRQRTDSSGDISLRKIISARPASEVAPHAIWASANRTNCIPVPARQQHNRALAGFAHYHMVPASNPH